MSTMDLTLCIGSDTSERDTNDVQLCDATAERDGSDIVLCAEDDGSRDGSSGDDPGSVDGVDCSTGVGIYISGDEDCSVGQQYTAAGAIGMVGFFITCGQISAGGEILNLDGCCGSAVITAIDQCGQVGFKTVRMPSGQWVYQETLKCYGDDPDCDGDICAEMGADINPYVAVDVISGDTLRRYHYTSAPGAGYGCAISIYKWECP